MNANALRLPAFRMLRTMNARSTAIAATLANGLDLPEAVREAQEYTWQALSAAFRPGMGQYIPDRFFWAREVSDGSSRT